MKALGWLGVCATVACTPAAKSTRVDHQGKTKLPMTPLQQSIAEGARDISFEVRTTSFALRRIPAGDFYMGSPPTERGHQATESPLRKITISQAFYLGRHEVTQLQYEAVTGQRRGPVRGDDLPVTQVRLFEAVAFCENLSAMLGVDVSLPTSAQWEYACRAGTTTRFYSGDDEPGLERIAWYGRNAPDGPRAVGGKIPNGFGLYDMLGNVWEYCRDDLDLTTCADRDPIGLSSSLVGSMHGGGWGDPADLLRCTSARATNERYGAAGFRISIATRTTPSSP